MPRKRTGTARAKRTTTRRKMLQGGNIFGDIFDRLKKPSTWLGAAGMLPTPFAGALKAGSVISGLTGNGRRVRRRRTGAKRQRGGRIIGATISH